MKCPEVTTKRFVFAAKNDALKAMPSQICEKLVDFKGMLLKLRTGKNGERGTGNGEQGTEKRERGTGNGNGKRKRKNGEHGTGEMYPQLAYTLP